MLASAVALLVSQVLVCSMLAVTNSAKAETRDKNEERDPKSNDEGIEVTK